MSIRHVRTQDFFEVEYEGVKYIVVEFFDFGEPTDLTVERVDGKRVSAEEFDDVAEYFSENDNRSYRD